MRLWQNYSDLKLKGKLTWALALPKNKFFFKCILSTSTWSYQILILSIIMGLLLIRKIRRVFFGLNHSHHGHHSHHSPPNHHHHYHHPRHPPHHDKCRSKLRDRWCYQIGWIFGKIPNGLWPPLIFGKLHCNIFIMYMVACMQGGMRAR